MFENSVLNEILNFESYNDLITTVELDKGTAENFFNKKIHNSIGNIASINVDYLAIEIQFYVSSLYDDKVELKLVLRNNHSKSTNIAKRIHQGIEDISVDELLIRIKLIAGLTLLMLIPQTSLTLYYKEGSDIVFGDEIDSYTTDDLFSAHPSLIIKFDIKTMEAMFSYLWFNFPQDITTEDELIKKITLEEVTTE